jgi:putative membrane protein
MTAHESATTPSETAGRDGAPAATSPLVPAPAPEHTGVIGTVRHVVFGFLMGAADVVPGVSGGTIALVCGIYARLIDAVRDGARAATNLARGRVGLGLRQLREVDWALLVPLLAGIGVAVVSLASVIEHQLEEEPVRIAGLFLGLVLGSVAVAVRLIRRPDARTPVIIVAVAVAMFVVLGVRQETSAEAADAATAPLWAYPAAAAVAICAMILPGVSGSFLLVLMGMYAHVLAAVNDREIGLLLLFVAGAVVGLGAFSRLLGWLMDHHHDLVVAAMIGLMLGSIRVLWPWPHGTETTELAAPSDDVVLPVVFAAVGLVVVLIVARLGVLKEEPPPNPG